MTITGTKEYSSQWMLIWIIWQVATPHRRTNIHKNQIIYQSPKKAAKKTEEDDFAVPTKKTQLKKSAFSNRPIYDTFGSAMTSAVPWSRVIDVGHVVDADKGVAEIEIPLPQFGVTHPRRSEIKMRLLWPSAGTGLPRHALQGAASRPFPA